MIEKENEHKYVSACFFSNKGSELNDTFCCQPGNGIHYAALLIGYLANNRVKAFEVTEDTPDRRTNISVLVEPKPPTIEAMVTAVGWQCRPDSRYTPSRASSLLSTELGSTDTSWSDKVFQRRSRGRSKEGRPQQTGNKLSPLIVWPIIKHSHEARTVLGKELLISSMKENKTNDVLKPKQRKVSQSA